MSAAPYVPSSALVAEHYATERSRAMVAGVVGFSALLIVLVPGLLIWAAYGLETCDLAGRHDPGQAAACIHSYLKAAPGAAPSRLNTIAAGQKPVNDA